MTGESMRTFRPQHLAVALLAAAASFAGAEAVHAQAQPYKPVLEQKDWTLNVGGGAIYGFSPSGGRTDRVGVIPYGDFSWKNRLYGNPLDGVGYNVVRQDRLHAGVQLRPRYSGDSDIPGTDIPGLTADAAAYAFARLPGNIVVGGRLMYDVTGETDSLSYFVSAGQQSVTPVGLLQTLVYARGSDGRGARAYFGVNPNSAPGAGVVPFRPDGGFQNVGIAALMMTPIGDKWAVGSFLNAERMVGDAADSPLIQARKNEEMAYRGGLIVVRRFGSK